ncbi:hypothetical protein BU14_0131s0012 [Porphyra umbilicalis]|uniref:RING-type domain-containing protein n=1 Tax=Porphyra umbilicalis TaxID=2786 RepID=A0A1X6PA94_PORUM|nr:hypothetical protein BU14_0131s0012 [Porphyra umbilicalis]|eukprot:OSX77829.1 hypothetical protein BU14_0131s0012 [Porphyra umbilicalis]
MDAPAAVRTGRSCGHAYCSACLRRFWAGSPGGWPTCPSPGCGSAVAEGVAAGVLGELLAARARAPPGGAHTCPSSDDGTPTAAATATAAWALGRVGLCTHCAAPVERVGGCDVVVCTACGDTFAWAPLWAPAAAAGVFGAPPDAVRAAADGAAVRVTVGTPPAPAPHGRPPRALLTCVCVVAAFAVAMLPLGFIYGLVLWATGNSSLSWIAVAVAVGLVSREGVRWGRRRREGGGGGREPRCRDARRRRRWGRRRHRQWRRGGGEGYG